MNLGYSFKNGKLLEQALTHASAGTPTYERLEFLGDRVLNLLVARMLHEAYPDAPEGELSKRHAALVRQDTLVDVAGSLGVAAVMHVGKGENAAKPSILADAVEAVLGAMYLDGGLEPAEALVRTHWQGRLSASGASDPKSELQELLQAGGLALPVYSVVGQEGADHARIFTIEVSCAFGTATAQGPSKQEASIAAARNLLNLNKAASNV